MKQETKKSKDYIFNITDLLTKITRYEKVESQCTTIEEYQNLYEKVFALRNHIFFNTSEEKGPEYAAITSLIESWAGRINANIQTIGE